MSRQDAPAYFIMVFLVLLALFIGLFLWVYPADARPISYFDDIKERYQGYDGIWRLVDNSNIAVYPWYSKNENSTHYILARMDDTLTIKKALVYNGSFDFGLTDISFTIVAPASKIQNISTANGTGQRRLPIDESLKTTFKRFTWDNKLPFVQIINNTGYNYTVPQSDYWYSRQSGQLYFNFKTANVTGLSADKNASFTFSSWTIDNATTSGYTSNNISTDGYWSAYGGGSIGTPLNALINANLSLYVDCEATQGTIQYGINRYGRFPNSSIQGTWNGNTTLNYTAGQNWGSACSFDGLDDYYDFGNDGILNNFKNLSIFFSYRQDVDIYGRLIGKYYTNDRAFLLLYDSSEKKLLFYVTNSTDSWNAYRSSTTNIIIGNYAFLNFVYNLTKLDINLNNTLDNGILTGNIPSQIRNSGETLKIGGIVDFFSGIIDEVIVDSSDNPIYSNSTYATSYYLNISNQIASAGKNISAVRFNVPYLNTLNNTANISVRQNGTSSWTQVSTNYQNWTWVNFAGWSNTDIRFEGNGDGSARMFIVGADVDEAIPTGTTYTLSGYVNNTDGADIIGAVVKANGTISISDLGGYYSISGLNGTYPLTTHAMGYNNYSGSASVSSNTTLNITLSEKDTITTNDAISYSIAFAMMFFVILRRRKKQ